MRKKKTSVLFIDTNGKEQKTRQVPTAIINNWKKYVFIFASTLILLIITIGLLINEYTSKYYTHFYEQKLVESKRIQKEVDLKEVKKTFKSIDENIFELNRFLNKKGLTNLTLESAGGDLDQLEITEVENAAIYYNSHIEKIKKVVENAPIGIPNNGEQSSGFGYRHNPFTGRSVEKHSGIDFKGKIGSPIKATAKGKVTFAGGRGGYGKCIIITHENGFETLYAHLSKIYVKEGQQVSVGFTIGALGNTGRSTGPHLHYEIIKDGEKIDPQGYLKP